MDIPRSITSVPHWKVRVIYNNTAAEEVRIDIVTYQNNDPKPYKTLNNEFLIENSKPISRDSKSSQVDIRMEDNTETIHIYSKTIEPDL